MVRIHTYLTVHLFKYKWIEQILLFCLFKYNLDLLEDFYLVNQHPNTEQQESQQLQ